MSRRQKVNPNQTPGISTGHLLSTFLKFTRFSSKHLNTTQKTFVDNINTSEIAGRKLSRHWCFPCFYRQTSQPISVKDTASMRRRAAAVTLRLSALRPTAPPAAQTSVLNFTAMTPRFTSLSESEAFCNDQNFVLKKVF